MIDPKCIRKAEREQWANRRNEAQPDVRVALFGMLQNFKDSGGRGL